MLNPGPGYIVTANQNPFPADYPYTVTGTFEPGFRSDRIRQLITQKEKWSVPQQLGIQRDIYSSFHHTLARRISEAAARKNISAPGPSRAIELLQEWDGRMEAARPQPMIAELTFQHFRTALGNAAAPGKGPAYQWRAVSNGVVDSLLRTRPDGWFEDWDQALLDAFDSALGEGVRMQGPDPAKWRWGQLNEIRLAHPVGTKVPLLNRRYDFEAAPLDGCQVCVNQASTALGPSQRMIIDFSDFDSSLLNIRLGQSAHPLSFHYKDQWQAFREGRSFPFRFNAFDAQSTLRLEPAR